MTQQKQKNTIQTMIKGTRNGRKVAALAATVLMLAAQTARAASIDEATARATARAFLAERGVVMTSNADPRKAPRRPGAQGEESVAYYVFDAGGDRGYVIVAGDDADEPVLGYVEQGSFDAETLPPALRDMLGWYADEAAQPRARRAERRKVTFTRHSVPALIRTKWNQGSPYNDSCPVYYREDGTTAQPAAGCTAVAYAQAMAHLRWPPRTVGTIPAHTNTYTLASGERKTVTMPAIPAGTPIDWDNMLDEYHGGETEAQRKAVADYMAMVGQAVRMGYGGESGASVTWALTASVDYFDFDDCLRWINRGEYDLEDWTQLLYDELEAGRPVIYQGFSTGAGHAFVIDGYDGKGLFHVNWGWGGGSDGWYLITQLQPGGETGLGSSSTSDGYTMGQAGVIRLRLPDETDDKEKPWLNVTSTTTRSSMVTVAYKNMTGEKQSFVTSMLKWDEEARQMVPVGLSKSITAMETSSTHNVSFNLRGALPVGTHILVPGSRKLTEKEWQPAYYHRHEFVRATVDSLGLTSLEHVTRSLQVAVDTFLFAGMRKVGENQQVSVRFRNLADEYYGTVYLFASQTTAKGTHISRAALTVPKGGTVTAGFYFMPEEAGTYNIWVCSNDAGTQEMGHTTVDITRNGTASKLRLASINIQNKQNNNIYGNKLVGTATVKNQSNQAFEGTVRLQLWVEADDGSYWWASTTKNEALSLEAQRSASVKFEFSNLVNNHQYQIVASVSGQEGYIENGGLWISDHYYRTNPGILYWKDTGAMGFVSARQLYSMMSGCGAYFKDVELKRLTLNDANPNTVYIFAPGTELPAITTELEHPNIVTDGHTERLTLRNGHPYYIDVPFDADEAVFSHTFPADYSGTGWATLTLPFAPETISLDDEPIEIGAEDTPFWIYEFQKVDNDQKPVFAPATRLWAHAPYLIAADPSLAGRTISFRAHNVRFETTGMTENVVSGGGYVLQSNTVVEPLKGGYHLNDEGTAFEYQASSKSVPALTAYFTTTLADGIRPDAIELPAVPTLSGIETVQCSMFNVKSVYDLAGRRVDNPRNGLFIVNGKKVRIK